MKIDKVESLAIPEIKIVRFARFLDDRGYFTEHFRNSDFQNNPETPFLKDVAFVQGNESFSRPGTVRGLHMQWNPYVGKLIRTLQGHMVDLILDIRKGSPTFGKIIAYDMPSRKTDAHNEWIWVPPGFAHGSLYLEETTIEYFCTGTYNPKCEASISPLAEDIDWALCDAGLRHQFQQITDSGLLLSAKDRAGMSLSAWAQDERSGHFRFISFHTADPR